MSDSYYVNPPDKGHMDYCILSTDPRRTDPDVRWEVHYYSPQGNGELLEWCVGYNRNLWSAKRRAKKFLATMRSKPKEVVVR